jgi:hypothetical protein
MQKHGLALCALGALALFASCSEDVPVVSAPDVDPTGDWTMTTTESNDPCNRSAGTPLVQDVRITRNGSNYELRIEGQPCSSPLVFSNVSPTGVGSYTLFSPVVSTDIGACAYQTRTILSITITRDTIHGTFVDSATTPGTQGSYYYGWYCGSSGICPCSCEVRKTIQGQRCDDCFDGCL